MKIPDIGKYMSRSIYNNNVAVSFAYNRQQGATDNILGGGVSPFTLTYKNSVFHKRLILSIVKHLVYFVYLYLNFFSMVVIIE